MNFMPKKRSGEKDLKGVKEAWVGDGDDEDEAVDLDTGRSEADDEHNVLAMLLRAEGLCSSKHLLLNERAPRINLDLSGPIYRRRLHLRATRPN